MHRKLQTQQTITCNSLGSRQLSWLVAMSLLFIVPLPLLVSVPMAVSVDTVGHKLYSSGRIAKRTKQNENENKQTIVSWLNKR